MKTKFSIMMAGVLLSLAAFAYGQAGTDVKKAAKTPGKPPIQQRRTPPMRPKQRP